jgi:endo-1,4-beta-xylanase
MTNTGKSKFTRRQFGWAALGFGAAGALGLGWTAVEEGRWRRKRQYDAAVQPGVTGPNSLQAHAAARGLLYGAAVDPELLDVEGVAKGHSTDGYTHLLAAQAGILVPENAMKWQTLRPTADTFDFTQADRLMRFAKLTGKRVRGHNLCWHESLPLWFWGTANKENARQLLLEHIRTAAEADPQAKLTYNDYAIETDSTWEARKRDQVLALLERLKASGTPIHAVGVQSHLDAAGPQPGAGLQSFIREAGKMGLEVYITEMDVNCRGMMGGVAERDAAVSQLYRNYLNLVLAEPNVPIALTWGITSAHAWMNQFDQRFERWPDFARQHPLPFDDDFNPMPAFLSLRGALDAAHPAAAATPASAQ